MEHRAPTTEIQEYRTRGLAIGERLLLDLPLALFVIFFEPAFSKSAMLSIFSSGSVMGTGTGAPPAILTVGMRQQS